jgi:hypothetical protein
VVVGILILIVHSIKKFQIENNNKTSTTILKERTTTAPLNSTPSVVVWKEKGEKVERIISSKASRREKSN